MSGFLPLDADDGCYGPVDCYTDPFWNFPLRSIISFVDGAINDVRQRNPFVIGDGRAYYIGQFPIVRLTVTGSEKLLEQGVQVSIYSEITFTGIEPFVAETTLSSFSPGEWVLSQCVHGENLFTESIGIGLLKDASLWLNTWWIQSVRADDKPF